MLRDVKFWPGAQVDQRSDCVATRSNRSALTSPVTEVTARIQMPDLMFTTFGRTLPRHSLEGAPRDRFLVFATGGLCRLPRPLVLAAADEECRHRCRPSSDRCIRHPLRCRLHLLRARAGWPVGATIPC